MQSHGRDRDRDRDSVLSVSVWWCGDDLAIWEFVGIVRLPTREQEG